MVLRRLSPLVLLAIAGALIVAFGKSPQQILADLPAQGDRLRGLVADWGLISPLVYVVAYAALMTTFWVPAWICSVVGGFLFGLWFGAVYALLGATLGATAVFLLVRRGVGTMTRHAGPGLRKFEAGFAANGFWFLILARLIPILPFSLVNVAAAIVPVRVWAYIASTVLGIIPSTLIYAGLGNGLKDGLDPTTWSRPGIVWPIAGIAALALLGMLYGRVRKGWRGP